MGIRPNPNGVKFNAINSSPIKSLGTHTCFVSKGAEPSSETTVYFADIVTPILGLTDIRKLEPNLNLTRITNNVIYINTHRINHVNVIRQSVIQEQTKTPCTNETKNLETQMVKKETRQAK